MLAEVLSATEWLKTTLTLITSMSPWLSRPITKELPLTIANNRALHYLASNQKLHSQQLSPRSHNFTESKVNNKKRLSELTS